jgi:hypothetical protein
LTITQPSPTLADRVYARTFAVATQGDDTAAVHELLNLAHGDAHLLGRVRDRFEMLQSERPLSEAVARALRLVTQTWVLAIEQR